MSHERAALSPTRAIAELEGSETAAMDGGHAQASTLFFPSCTRIGTGKGMPERLRCCRAGQTESVLPVIKFSFCEQNGTVPCSPEQACSMTSPAPLPSCKGS